MLRYRLRTLLMLLALLPPMLAVGWRQWLSYSRAQAIVAQCELELAAARKAVITGSQIGFKKELARVRRAQLKLARQREAAEQESTVYRLIAPFTSQ